MIGDFPSRAAAAVEGMLRRIDAAWQWARYGFKAPPNRCPYCNAPTYNAIPGWPGYGVCSDTCERREAAAQWSGM